MAERLWRMSTKISRFHDSMPVHEIRKRNWKENESKVWYWCQMNWSFNIWWYWNLTWIFSQRMRFKEREIRLNFSAAHTPGFSSQASLNERQFDKFGQWRRSNTTRYITSSNSHLLHQPQTHCREISPIMSEQLVMRGTLEGHTGWVTSLATSLEKLVMSWERAEDSSC